MSRSSLVKHYVRLLRQWPQDQLRGITFQDVMRRRMMNRLAASVTSPDVAVASKSEQVTATSKFDDQAEMQQIDAMYSLLENRYSNQYKTSESLMRPAFRPTYYEDLAAEMKEAPNRGWLSNKWLRWSKLVRFT